MPPWNTVCCCAVHVRKRSYRVHFENIAVHTHTYTHTFSSPLLAPVTDAAAAWRAGGTLRVKLPLTLFSQSRETLPGGPPSHRREMLLLLLLQREPLQRSATVAVEATGRSACGLPLLARNILDAQSSWHVRMSTQVRQMQTESSCLVVRMRRACYRFKKNAG